MRLTKSSIDRIEPPPLKDGKPVQAFYRDETLPGFGLRVSSGGTKSFIVEKRIKRKVKRFTIGKYGAITPEQARIKAAEMIGDIILGVDLDEQKQNEEALAVTLNQAFESYLLTRKSLKPSTRKNYTDCIDRYLPDWIGKRLIDITKDMVEKRHREIGTKTESKANNTMRVLRAIFNHAMEKYENSKGHPIIVVNPVDRLSKTRAWYKDKRRKDHLKPHQLKAWYDATNQLQNTFSRDCLQLILFTGLRKNEALTLKWSDIDFDDKTLTVRDTKNSEPHTLPLTDFLLSLLKERNVGNNSEWVFPGPKPEFHLKEPRTAIDRVIDNCGIEFTLHDLRRTFITIAESLEISAYSLKRLANHKTNDITGSYIISGVERLRKPMEEISQFLINKISHKD